MGNEKTNTYFYINIYKYWEMSKILLTGASGFIGRNLYRLLLSKKFDVIPTSSREINKSGWVLFNLNNVQSNLTEYFESVDVVIHTAARVHVMQDLSIDPLLEFRKANTLGTINIARQAAIAGVKRFIYISSIKVNGEVASVDAPFTETDEPSPNEPYSISKYEAECGLFSIASETGMEVVIIRPPLVYGPDVKANFLNMMKWLNKGIPLPLGSIHNKRSLVALDNLVDLILTCIDHPAAANQVFLVSDGEDLSTTELLNRVAISLGEKPRLLPINQQLLELSLSLIGKKSLAQRLCGSLQVDISKAKKLLNWTPPVSVDEGLRKTARHFLESQSK